MFSWLKQKSRPEGPVREVFRLEGLPVPVHLYVESRRNSRISLLRDKINVRLPRRMPAHQRQRELQTLLDWARKRIGRQSVYLPEPLRPDYLKLDSLRVNGSEWALVRLDAPGSKTFRARLCPDSAQIHVSGPFSGMGRGQAGDQVRKAVTGALSRHYAEYATDLVARVNQNTFQYPYKQVRLKYMTSRWGSCSAKGNINLSLRLLLLPEDVREYIVVHELAHLREMNHSARFWALVERHVPDYRSREAWLKKHSAAHDF